MADYYDPKRCKECGECCHIFDGNRGYPFFKPTSETWKARFKESGADKFKPVYDTSLKASDLRKQGVNPNSCPYLGENGCILPRENVPKICKEYRCQAWIDEDKRKNI